MAWGSCYTPEFRVASVIGAATGTTAANDRRLIENVVGVPTFVIDAIDTGRYGLRMSQNASGVSVAVATMISGGRYIGLLARIRVTAFTTTCRLLWCIASTVSQNVHLRVNSSTGELAYSFDNAGTWVNSGVFLTAGVTAAIEMFVDYNTGTTHTLKVRVNGSEVINATGGTTIVTSGNTPANFGELAASASMVVDYADLATYNDVAEYGTIGADWRVWGLEPTVDGTHSMTANDFQDAASADLTNASTGTFAHVDDAPGAAPDVTAFVKQVVVRSTSYMEWVLRAMPNTYGNPLLVCLAAAMHPVASAVANAVAFQLNAGGNVSAETAIDTSIASNTLEYRKHHYATRPGGAAWLASDVTTTPLRARFGFNGTAITAPPALDSVMAFVLAPNTTPNINMARTR